MRMILSEQRHNGGGRRRRSEENQERHRSGQGRDGADPTHHAGRRVGYEQISGRHIWWSPVGNSRFLATLLRVDGDTSVERITAPPLPPLTVDFLVSFVFTATF